MRNNSKLDKLRALRTYGIPWLWYFKSPDVFGMVWHASDETWVCGIYGLSNVLILLRQKQSLEVNLISLGFHDIKKFS